jgi:hypothetical protein
MECINDNGYIFLPQRKLPPKDRYTRHAQLRKDECSGGQTVQCCCINGCLRCYFSFNYKPAVYQCVRPFKLNVLY